MLWRRVGLRMVCEICEEFDDFATTNDAMEVSKFALRSFSGEYMRKRGSTIEIFPNNLENGFNSDIEKRTICKKSISDKMTLLTWSLCFVLFVLKGS